MANTNTKIKREFPGEQTEENGKHKHKHKNKIFNLKMLNRVLFLLAIVAGIYYLTGINDLTVKGFRLQEVKKEINRLSEENRNIELKVMSLESYNNLSQRAKGLSMVAAGEIDYITAVSEIVAKK